MNKFKIYKIIENNISSSIDNKGNILNKVNYNRLTLSSLPVKIGNLYVCMDTLNLYVDTKSGRIPLEYTFINTENERLNLKNIINGYYYVGETNVLWVYHGLWEIYAENKDDNYPGQSINDNSYNIFSDSFKILVNKNDNNSGSLVINPDISIIVEGEEIEVEHDNKFINENGDIITAKSKTKSKKIDRIVKSKDYGKMIFNGDYYTKRNDGTIRLVTDDGCIDNLVIGDQPIEGGDA